jgi:tripartite-type tricarboxylate transporter receptor subunit TctC
VVGTLHAALVAGVEADEVKARYRELGVEASALSPAEFQAFVRRETTVWRPLIRELGIRLDS